MPTERDTLRGCLPAVIRWYAAERRALPWREEPTPYHIWISEIMLQQTRIEAVLGYYARFLEAFPDIPALAAADEDRLMKLWQGLGYYSRARNLKKAAERLVRDYGGELPHTAAELKKLPGLSALLLMSQAGAVTGDALADCYEVARYADRDPDAAALEAAGYFVK